MAAVTGRSIFRSIPTRRAASNIFFALPRRMPSSSSPAARFLRSPVELTSCVDSLLPMHSVIASTRMTSMLSFSTKGYVWLSEGKDDM